MVVRLHRRVAADERAEPGAVLDPHLVVAEDAGHRAVLLVADDVRQVLDEVAAARDVQDCEPRQTASTGRSRASAACRSASSARSRAGRVPLVAGCGSAP